MDKPKSDQLLTIPDDTPIGERLGQQQRELLNKSQPLLMMAHRAIVHDVQERDGEFLPFGIGVSTNGELCTVFVEPNPLFPDGEKILIGEDQSSFGVDNIGVEKAIGYVTLMLQNKAHTGRIVVAVNCFPSPVIKSENNSRTGTINICLEDIHKTAIYCFGTYHLFAGGQGWEFSNLSGKAMESIIFKKPDQDFNSLLV